MAQIDESFPAAREPDPDARMHPAARLAKALSRVSVRELSRRNARLVVLIDGLDAYDPPAGALPGDPLAAFLPQALPRRVGVLCASRPRHSYVSSLADEFAATLHSLGTPQSVEQTSSNLRGGMTGRRYQVKYASEALTISVYETADGKLEQFLVDEDR